MIANKEEHFRDIAEFRFPRYEEIPDIGLYLDQVVNIVNHAVYPLYTREKPSLTGAMVNNYTKIGLLDPANKKKYSRNHVCKLIAICLLKEIFSLPELCVLFDIQRSTNADDVAYNNFCLTFEEGLKSVFFPDIYPDNYSVIAKANSYKALLNAMVLATINRIYVEKSIMHR